MISALMERFGLANVGVLRHLDVIRKYAGVKLTDISEAQLSEITTTLGFPLPENPTAKAFILGTVRSGGDVTLTAMFDDTELLKRFAVLLKQGIDAKVSEMRQERTAQVQEVIELPNFSVLSAVDLMIPVKRNHF